MNWMGSGKDYSTRASEILGYVETRREPISLFKGFAAELFGTMLVVLVWIGTAASFGRSTESSVALSLAVGFVVAAMIWVTECVSGGHLNPGVTFGMIFTRHISPLKGVVYIVAQTLGGIFGSGILIGLTANPQSKYGTGFNATVTIPNADLSVGQALGVEIAAAVIIVLVAMAVKDENRQDVIGSGPVAVGFSMASCHFAFMFDTGPSLNPARSFGPAVWSGIWTSHWIYWVGPFLGGFIAALLHLGIFKAPAPTILEVEGLNPPPQIEEENIFVQLPLTPDAERRPNNIPDEEAHELIEVSEVIVETEADRQETPEEPTQGSQSHVRANATENEKELIV